MLQRSALGKFYVHLGNTTYQKYGVNLPLQNEGKPDLATALSQQRALNKQLLTRVPSMNNAEIQVFTDRLNQLTSRDSSYRQWLKQYLESYKNVVSNDFIQAINNNLITLNKRKERNLITVTDAELEQYARATKQELQPQAEKVTEIVNLIKRIKTYSLSTIKKNLKAGETIHKNTIAALNSNYSDIVKILAELSGKKTTNNLYANLLAPFFNRDKSDLAKTIGGKYKYSWQDLIDFVEGAISCISYIVLSGKQVKKYLGEATAAAIDSKGFEIAKKMTQDTVKQCLKEQQQSGIFNSQTQAEVKIKQEGSGPVQTNTPFLDKDTYLLLKKYGVIVNGFSSEDKIDNEIILIDNPLGVSVKEYSKAFYLDEGKIIPFKRAKGFHLQAVQLPDTIASIYLNADFFAHWLNLKVGHKPSIPNGLTETTEELYFLIRYQALAHGNILKQGKDVAGFLGFVDGKYHLFNTKYLLQNSKFSYLPNLMFIDLKSLNTKERGKEPVQKLVSIRLQRLYNALDKSIDVYVDPIVDYGI